MVHKKQMERNNGRNENEKILYHGTEEENVQDICKKDFNRSYCGTNGSFCNNFIILNISFELLEKGVAYGKGVYIALNSSYSHSYTNSTNRLRRIIRRRVLVCLITVGDESMKAPPNGYDSTGNDDSSIFVCYRDDQCYREYLISYK